MNLGLKNIICEDVKNLDIKLINFESAIYLKKQKVKGLIGPYEYLCPEKLYQQYSEKCDIWNCGVILYFLISGNFPFQLKNLVNCVKNFDTQKKIDKKCFKLKFEETVWYKITQGAALLIMDMLSKDPNERPSAKQCLKSE